MALRRLIQQNHNANLVGFSAGSAGQEQALPMDTRRIQHLANTVGTLPRGHKQLALTRSSSLGDSSRPQRHLVAILKEDKETFGFEIQTIRFPHQNDYSLEVCTCVCKVQEESPAHLSGLQTGDILSSINGVNTDGFSHKQIVDLIKSSGNYLRLETVNGAMFRRKMELETKLQLLKQTLQQRWVELRSLLAQERRLLQREVNDNAVLGALELEVSGSLGGCSIPGALFPTKPRFSSESSSRSRLSSMTVDSEDSFYQGGAFEDSATERSMSPLWEGSSCSSSFGTLPRKSRRASVRKHLSKFIPGLHRAVEEEESRV
ncbi:PREDICTED: cytohesin-interacting protein [Tauraco erythrolophus]|uniref:cytohesin-interacting protein n=1 Tax=Tauraco erythrolophus TaxID=121530 RepID=UPI0005236A09|nr:PREDICTED: cytohesin-interacting protein [Tauraco erythrolophus]